MSTNVVQKATGASPTGLTDSLIFDNASSVGVGTTTPSSRLHVFGTSDAEIRSQWSGGALGVFRGVAGTVDVGSFSNHDLRIFTNSAEVARIQSGSGNVGIGRGPSTDTRLHVSMNNSGSSGDQTVQIDMDADQDVLGGVWAALNVNARALEGSSWDPSGGQLFGASIEATLAEPSTSEATVMALNLQSKLLIGATGSGEITGCEIDLISEEVPTYRMGLQIGAVPASGNAGHPGEQASGFDVMLGFGNKINGAPFKDGILFFNVDGTQWPIDTTGYLLRASPDGAETIAGGIDISDSNLSISGNAFASKGFAVSGAGNVTLTSNDPAVTFVDSGGTANSFSLRSADGLFILRDVTDSADRFFVDGNGNVGIGPGQFAFGTGAVSVLGLKNGTAPTTSPADMVQLFSADASAGSATLGLRTEATVATESVTSDRTLRVVINGTVYKVCLKA